ncbi:hypothetical protein Dsin_020253 [Dipteronia sinensis]|uniref:RNase H type-1 domain-containing protein n=1 Tax=Dipteronia sinensis TaxID=43782 RepID=A0AAE0A8V8_9ROSI|nr:hypothetical protein Dsin_020253 [Dipteronia sinensis]
MSAKWIWRFGGEKEALWRRVIMAKYGILVNSVMWSWKLSTNDFFLKRAIRSLSKKFHNQKVFENKDSIFAIAADLVKFRIVWWFKHFGKNVTDSISSLMLNVKDLCVKIKRVKKSMIKDLIPPLMDTFKFNVNGSVRGRLNPTSIGGVLTDSEGKVLWLFSYSVGLMDFNSAEILASKKVVELCLFDHSLRVRVISIVCDSKVAVSWINNNDFYSIEYVNLIYYIQFHMKLWHGLEVVHVSRMFNSFTENLAKLGFSSNGNILHWV